MSTTKQDALRAVTLLQPQLTVEERLALELRRRISYGVLRPGEILPYRKLADDFDVSVTPVRTAMRELAKEGLVEITARRHARVARLSVEDLEEVFAARMGLEVWLVRKAVEALSDDDLARMSDRQDAVEEATRFHDHPAYLRAVWEYRSACYMAAQRPRLYETVSVLYQRAARYSLLTVADERRFERSLEFVRRFADACARRDSADAQYVIRKSLEWTLECLTAALPATVVLPEPEAANRPRRDADPRE